MEKQLLSFEGLSYYDELIKKYISSDNSSFVTKEELQEAIANLVTKDMLEEALTDLIVKLTPLIENIT